MAFECQTNSKIESFHQSYDLSCILKPNFSKKPLKKQSLPLRKTTSDNDDAASSPDDGSACGGRRLITDLPAALVSEILHCLDAKDLGIVSCVSTFLHKLATNHFGWKNFYFERWGPPPTPSPPECEAAWRELFVERELKSRCFMGRYSLDVLHGHTEAILAVFMLKSAKLVFTGGYDAVVRMWDLEDGMLVSKSRPLGCTVRAIAADEGLLVVGGTNAFIQCWKVVEGNPCYFDVTGFVANDNNAVRLWGHEGPITCLALDLGRIYSGSWDMSIRVWDRTSMKCVLKLRHADWVWSLMPRGGTVASTAGTHAYIWDVESGELVDVVRNAHSCSVTSLARSYSGDLLFTGGQDGSVHMFEVGRGRSDDSIRMVATWKPHTGGVNALAFEFPWLVSASSDGKLALINVRRLLKCSRGKHLAPLSEEPPQRMLHGYGNNLFSVAVSADRIVCGGDEGVVRVWNFSQALEAAKRAQTLRAMRLENRMRRKKVQIELLGRTTRSDQGIVSAKKNQMNGSQNGIWNGKQRDKKS